MEHVELVLFGLLLAVSALAILARLVQVPYPILLTLGGLGFAFIPGVPDVSLEPDLVLLIFLPPLLYAAAFFANLRELRNNLRPISGLAIGLVAGTMGAVAVVAHAAIGLSWPVAFVLGAVVSPSDAVAPTAILRRLGVPRQVVSIVQGENLTNDWTALVTYKFAVAAVTTGGFSLAHAAPEFVLTGVGGIGIGVVVGIAIAAVRRRIDDPLTEITVSLLTTYAAYLPAEQLGVSGVLASVTVGVWLGWQSSALTNHTTRLQLNVVWQVLEFLLNAVLFVLVGLQLPAVLDALTGRSAGELIADGAIVAGVVIAFRMVYVFFFLYLPRNVRGRLSRDMDDPDPRFDQAALVAWSSMRGAVSLAAALAIPLEVDGGGAFPDRALVIFIAFCVILATLVGQGLTFPAVVRALRVEPDTLDEDEELSARLEIAFAATDKIDQLAEEDWVYDGTPDRVRGQYEYRQRRFSSRIDGADEDGREWEHYEQRTDAFRRFMNEVIGAERAKLIEMRDGGEISDEVRRTVEYDLDLEESRLDS